MFIKNEMVFKRNVPADGVCCIYLLISDKEGVIYVGQTTALAGRISGHTSSGKAFDRFEYMICDHNDADELECTEILRYNPPLNTQLPPTERHISIGPLKKLLVAEFVSKIDRVIADLPRTFARGAKNNTRYKYVSTEIISNLKGEIERINQPTAKEGE